ncbi:hypothetical protein SADUNF_Sadunf17G0025700 [Salix dunnii]|uniref:Gnk2-homologous domain-containing protein n=1 Tax=Salix dunnii TaxID=1413687 RepID=A0A835J4C3_9ROSI|nr:hypothetical protein SADUNF_Sadunf17G0025700 [Salix dunnii]
MQSVMLDAMFLLLVSCLLHFFCISKGKQVANCDNSMNYTSGSAYQKNLNLTLTSLTAHGYVSTAGQNPNLVYGLVNCPGFVSVEDCQTCADSVAKQIIQLCPNQKTASVIDESCSLQYSDRDFFSTADIFQRLDVFNGQNADDKTLFNNQLRSLLGNISFNAATDPSRLAVGRITYTSYTSIYGMVQCIRNLTANECLLCLQSTSRYILQRSDEAVGARVYTLSCIIRFEMYLFFSLSSLPPPPPSPPPPPPPSNRPNSTATGTKDSTRNDGKTSSKTVVAVVISAAITSTACIAIVCGCLFLRKGKTTRGGDLVNNYRHDDEQPKGHGVHEESYTLIDSFSIGLNTLREATGDFCDEYKLGEGTCGYMAPEYAKKGHFSTQSDVYSFGILILEIVTGQKVSSFFNSVNLQSYAWQHWADGAALEVVDPTLGGQWPENDVLMCIHIGLLCVQEALSDRPKMSQIVTMLSGNTITSPAPSRPAFYMSKGNSRSYSGTRDSGSSKLPESSQPSINQVSITELSPRK